MNPINYLYLYLHIRQKYLNKKQQKITYDYINKCMNHAGTSLNAKFSITSNLPIYNR